MRLHSSLGLLVPLAFGVKGDNDGPPDFSSYQYPGQPKERSFKPSYDICVVGGGAAGLAIGNRLSESGKHTVVVFEAGPAPTVVENYSPPGGNRYGLNGYYSEIDYNFYSAPQPTLKNRTLNYQRGRCLGGSGVTNGLFYGLGSKSIYDAWEAEGNPGWGWKEIQASAKRGAKFVGNPNHTNDNTYMTWDPDAYGTEGPLKIAFQGQVPTSNPSFMNATSAIGIQPTFEQNSGNPLGVKQGTMTLDENFLRSTSFDSYYKQALGRPNFQVLDRSIVSNVIFDPDSCKNGSTPQAIGVTFLDQPSGIIHNVFCRNEVILSGGAFHSPFILKQSGIGPKEELEEFGITLIVVNENVGANMQDHTAVSIVMEIKPEFAHLASTDNMTYDFNIINKEQRDFWAGGSKRWNSKISATGGTTNAFKQMSDAELENIGAGELVQLNLTGQAHNEFSYNSLWYPQVFSQYGKTQPGKAYISIFVSNMVAQSKGTVKLGSNVPFSAPVLDNNYLAEVVDQRMAVHGLREIRKIMAHPDLAQWSAGEASPGANVTSDEDLLDYARTTMIPKWHASSTCRMLPREKGGVVDSHLKVYGTKGLRVIDVSTFGRLPDINLIGSVYAVAENGARIIREEYGDY